jgi:hypothetical protein
MKIILKGSDRNHLDFQNKIWFIMKGEKDPP